MNSNLTCPDGRLKNHSAYPASLASSTTARSLFRPAPVMAKAPFSKTVSDEMLFDVREHLLIAANSALVLEVKLDADSLSSVRRDMREAMWRLDQLQACFDNPKEYREALINGVRLLDAEADMVIIKQNLVGSVIFNGISRLATVSQVTTEHLQKAFSTYLEAPECHIDVTHVLSKLPKMLPEDSFFYPFMAYLHSEDFSYFLAEALATVAIYLDSGWVERDLTDKIPGGDEGKAVRAFREIYNDLRTGNSVSGTDIKTTMRNLFSFRKMDIKVQAHDKARLGYIASAASAGSETRWPMDEEIPGPGFADVVIRDARNPSKIHMAIVTANDDSKRHGDQLARYIQAFQQSILNDVPPFKEGDEILAQFFSLPLVYTDEEFPNQIARQIVNGLDHRLNVDGRKAINSLALTSQLARAHLAANSNPEGVIRTRHRNLGAAESFSLPRDMPVDEVVKVMADTIAKTVDIVKAIAPSVAGTMTASMRTLIKSSAESAMGLLGDFAEYEKSLTSLICRREVIQVIADYLEMKRFVGLENEWQIASFRASHEWLRRRAKSNESQGRNDMLKRYHEWIRDSASKARGF
ncbi:hypothetical protein OIV56_13535 [Burkholderia pseudomallei]|uniref:hypothetical protein n=1 Tax=Burkholderia pseudomallei TaxID=28450 RepID=UPI0021F74A42|nr:hypothetical protein [Burkholderia pseudomallei]MCW0163749.1 hypothetical protein [Burkholderia pseudomallei]